MIIFFKCRWQIFGKSDLKNWCQPIGPRRISAVQWSGRQLAFLPRGDPIPTLLTVISRLFSVPINIKFTSVWGELLKAPRRPRRRRGCAEAASAVFLCICWNISLLPLRHHSAPSPTPIPPSLSISVADASWIFGCTHEIALKKKKKNNKWLQSPVKFDIAWSPESDCNASKNYRGFDLQRLITKHYRKPRFHDGAAHCQLNHLIVVSGAVCLCCLSKLLTSWWALPAPAI